MKRKANFDLDPLDKICLTLYGAIKFSTTVHTAMHTKTSMFHLTDDSSLSR